jgi:hypothetical protein
MGKTDNLSVYELGPTFVRMEPKQCNSSEENFSISYLEPSEVRKKGNRKKKKGEK